MASKKNPPTKDTAIEEIDLSAFDMGTIDLSLSSTPSLPEPEAKRPPSRREVEAFDDSIVGADEANPEEEVTSKNDFDDDFEDPFDPDADDAEEK